MSLLCCSKLRFLLCVFGIALVSILSACRVNTTSTATAEQLPVLTKTETQPVPTPTRDAETSTITPSNTPQPPTETRTPQNQETSIITVYNVDTLQQIDQVMIEGAKRLIWLNNGDFVAIITDEDIIIYQRFPQAIVDNLANVNPRKITASRDGKTLAWTDDLDSVYSWNVFDGSDPRLVSDEPVTYTAIALSTSGDLLSLATDINQLLIFSTGTGELQSEFQYPFWLSDVSFSPDGELLGGVDSPNFTVHLIDASSGEIQDRFEWIDSVSPNLYGAYFSPDWSSLAWVARSEVQLMDVATGELGPYLGHEDAVNSISWAPDGGLLASASSGTTDIGYSPVVLLWEVEGGELTNTLIHENAIIGVGFSPIGDELGVLTYGGALNLWGTP